MSNATHLPLMLTHLAKQASKIRGKYDEKLQVKGSFMDLIGASMKHADKVSADKRSELEKKVDAMNNKKKP
jgi:hypothetical protein